MRYRQPAALTYWYENTYCYRGHWHIRWSEFHLGYGAGPLAQGAALGSLPLLFSAPTIATLRLAGLWLAPWLGRRLVPRLLLGPINVLTP
jgi:hypothetical protein